MENIQVALDSVFKSSSDQDYERSLAYFRFWFGIGQTYSQIPSDLIFDMICKYRETGRSHHNFIYPAARPIFRFISDAESDPLLALHSAGLRDRFCTRILQEFFYNDLSVVRANLWHRNCYYMDANLIAHCVNLGYMEEDTIRSHILQSLISHDKLYDHQAYALIVLFKIAGATFGAYADLAIVDRCFKLLKNHKFHAGGTSPSIQVSAFSVQKRWN